MKSICIYYEICCLRTGIETWIKTLYEKYKDKCHITILFKVMANQFIGSDLPFTQWDEKENYHADILFIMHANINIPTNIKYNNRYFVLHGDPRHLKIPKDINESELFTVSRECQQWLKEKHNLDSICIENYVLPYKPKRVLNLISCSRINYVKGYMRMKILADQLHENNVNFVWINYNLLDFAQKENLKQRPCKYIIQHSSLPHEQLLDRIAVADYLVQLSEHESYCYAVNEALSLGTPVIVTDIEVFSQIKNRYNGYKLNLNMSDIPLNDIVNNIPKNFDFQQNIEEIEKCWENILT